MANVNVQSRRWCFTWFPGPELLDEEQKERPVENILCELWMKKFQLYEKISGLIFGLELCPTTKRVHLQGYLETPKKIWRNSLFKCLVAVSGLTGIMLQASRGSAEQNIAYCSKGEQSHAEWESEGVDGPNYGLNAVVEQYGEFMLNDKSKASERYLSCVELAKDGSIGDLWREYPDVMVKHFKGMSELVSRMRCSNHAPVRNLDEFQWNINETFDYSVSYVLWGESGIGKTSYARAILPTALVVSHLDALREYDPQLHGGIIFDDMSFLHMPRTAQIHLLDIDYERQIHCRYSCAVIPANTKKIFTSNVKHIFLENDAAISRRVRIIELIKTL